MKKRYLVIVAATILGLMTLAGCKSQGPEDSSGSESGSEVTSGVISDVNQSDTEIHEAILPQEFTEGETVENPYYKRTTNTDGDPVYAVIKASNNQQAYLPIAQTTIYHREDGDCYFEQTTLTYNVDGVETSRPQYDLWVVDAAVVEQVPAPGTSADTP